MPSKFKQQPTLKQPFARKQRPTPRVRRTRHERILQNARFPPIFATHSHLYINAQIHFKTSSANHNHEEKRGGSWGEYLVLDAIVAKVHKPISSGWRSQAPVVEWLPLNSYRSSIASWRYVKVASSILAGGTTFCELNHCRIIF